MKPLCLHPLCGLSPTLIFATFCMVASASAQVRTWTTTFPTGDTGNWSDTTRWSGANVPDVTGESAVFGAYANDRVVTVDGAIYAIDALTITPRTSGFSAKNFTLNTSGGGALQLGSGGLTIGNGGTTTINAPIELTANQIWTTNSDTAAGSVILAGVISGNFSLTRNAQFQLPMTFSGANTFSGGFINNSVNALTRIGGNEVITSGTLASGALGTGTVTLNAGRISSNGGTGRTISNNVILGGGVFELGNSSQTGTLTFSDVGLTTASTFSLGSLTNSNVSVLRVGTSNLTFDQVIAESGGTGQSLNFAATSGTPVVTLNRTKTAGGNLLVGGLSLVLGNGAANTGSLVGVGGSITATGANKFSSGALITDAGSIIATDATNFNPIAGGRATVYNNGRVGFATDQTQTTLAGLFTPDSQLRVGLSSAALSPTVTENYNQSAIGNGKAGLVSASTGTVTYSGALTAGSDNTYRVGGGLGTLALSTALSGSGANLIVESGGTLTTSANNGFTGTTIINSSATLTGANGVLSGTSGVTVNAGATLTLNNATGAVNPNRIADSAGITLNNSFIQLSGTSTGGLTETVGNLTIGAGGRSFVTIATTPAAATIKTLQFGDLIRQNNAVVTFRGDTLGTTATARNEIKFTTAPTLVGGGGAAGSTTISILPFARGGTAAANASTGFVTYAANGIRRLDNTTEFVQANNDTTARIDQAIATAGGATNYNVRSIPGTAGNATLVNTASSSVTLNALLFDSASATDARTYGFNSSTVNVTSGAVHIQNSVGFNLTLNSGTLAFGSAEGVITNNGNGFYLTTLGTQITGTGGLSVYNVNGGGVSLGGVTNSGFSGGLTIGGNGFIGVDQDQRFGNAANSVTHGGGTLQFFSGFTSSRALILLGNVGDNILANNNNASQTQIWNGDISGAGRLRLINNASSGSTANGFSLGGGNTYAGGTQIEGINVTGTTNTALGTGTVTLVGANNNPAALTLTGTAPALGGLRGTDGSVIISPTAATATLTVGANNENTVFNGTIQQGAGKTASLTKTGTGTLVLAGSLTYTGTTTVADGTLNLLGSTASSAINVDSGKLLINSSTALGTTITVGNTSTLGGGGTAFGPAVIQSGGELAPGNSPGVMTFANLSMQTGSNFEFELTANTTAGLGLNYDGVNILPAGSLTLGSGVTSSLVFNSAGSTVNWSNSFWSSNQSWRVVDVVDNNYANPLFSSLTFTTDSAGQSLASIRSGAAFDYSVTAGDIFLNYSIIPEPSTAALLACVGSVALLRRRRG